MANTQEALREGVHFTSSYPKRRNCPECDPDADHWSDSVSPMLQQSLRRRIFHSSVRLFGFLCSLLHLLSLQ